MRQRISTWIRKHPWLAGTIAIYLALSGIEATRNLLLARPLDDRDTGFSSWQEMPVEGVGGGVVLFRWADARSSMVRPVQAAVLGVMVIDSGTTPTTVTFAIGDQVLDTYSVIGADAYSFRYYLPPILGADTWSAVKEFLATRPRARTGPAPGRWQELNPWRRLPEPPSIRIETSLSATTDGRADGTDSSGRSSRIGIASVEWLHELPPGGAGFHRPETDSDGNAYRWTRRWAAIPLELRGRQAVVRIRAIHPDIARRPVVVDFFWEANMLRTVSLSSSAWTDVAVELPPESSRDGVLSIRADRTWSPSRAGISGDTRELGIGVAGVTWR